MKNRKYRNVEIQNSTQNTSYIVYIINSRKENEQRWPLCTSPLSRLSPSRDDECWECVPVNERATRRNVHAYSIYDSAVSDACCWLPHFILLLLLEKRNNIVPKKTLTAMSCAITGQVHMQRTTGGVFVIITDIKQEQLLHYYILCMCMAVIMWWLLPPLLLYIYRTNDHYKQTPTLHRPMKHKASSHGYVHAGWWWCVPGGGELLFESTRENLPGPDIVRNW